ncbi:MAG TPA: antibiotic biosynthesis monooxygenase [Oceanospirillales bacterium]|nr:antibiotic biosynthesis monooxygenase [Oceanospirillales bacterium]
MIARIWHGRTKLEDMDVYTEFMKSKAVPDYKGTKGFVKLSFLRHIEGEVAHFTLITYWQNLEVIKNFAGEDYETPKYYDKDKQYLLEFEDKVTHYEVFAE